jgi:hypothetical protein
MLFGPSWHSLAITPKSIEALGRAGSCYLKEVRFPFYISDQSATLIKGRILLPPKG